MSDFQDWNTVVFRKPLQNNSELAKKRGYAVETQKKNIKNSLYTNDNNMRKLDDETDTFKHKKVSTNLKIAIQKGRTLKKMTQANLAQSLNLPVITVKNYENGTAIPNNSVLSKMEKVLGIKLTGKINNS
tara:strand:- start:14 stop:403 length:390 start_codon:yes stop_codon:yes gene_type:complete